MKLIAKRIIDKEKLSKSEIEWDIPNDLIHYLERTRCSKCNQRMNTSETLIGFGRWKNEGGKYKKSPFVCIARNKELIYLEKPIVKEIWNWVKKRKF